MEWNSYSIGPKRALKKKHSIQKQIHDHQDNAEDNWLLDSNYQPEDIHTIAKEQIHLNDKHRGQLA